MLLKNCWLQKQKIMPLLLALLHLWGNGKTSFLYMMKEHIDAEFADDVVTISFHPWKYGKSSNLTYLFFEELSKALAPYSTIFFS